ncbi:uncharacterized protein BDR25DRAFT_594 [Lindgomyces ingoldianus]|uniref:Uncharacterized protein n=1 Tax=Lindgomyces ingoldianus TaxID=673940 RepID=A0ACB6RE71_9PLEO|nr:uncharacterized protein BDR25DRAFT_594 [Lindgomyces ingoldianus]KAF2477422.1 hypothetical protein BDR25DRAFT_594 [Lindgomyces ingoldianus]
MPIHLAPRFRRQPFSTAARVYPSIPSHFHSYHPPAPQTSPQPPAMPKLGRISRWYLPAMAFIAVGTLFLPSDLFSSSPSSSQKQSLDSANKQLGIAIANALEEYNMQHMSERQKLRAQAERNAALLEAYGERMSLADVEKALEVYEVQ